MARIRRPAPAITAHPPALPGHFWRLLAGNGPHLPALTPATNRRLRPGNRRRGPSPPSGRQYRPPLGPNAGPGRGLDTVDQDSPLGKCPAAPEQTRKPKEASVPDGWLFGWVMGWPFLPFSRSLDRFSGVLGLVETNDLARPAASGDLRPLRNPLLDKLLKSRLQLLLPHVAAEESVQLALREPIGPGMSQLGNRYQGRRTDPASSLRQINSMDPRSTSTLPARPRDGGA